MRKWVGDRSARNGIHMGRPAKYDDAEVLRRATDLVWRRGVGDVGIRDLQDATDLTAPALYRRFGSKDELLARCLRSYTDGLVAARIRQHLGPGDDLRAGLRDFFVTALARHPSEELPRGCLLTNTATAAVDGEVLERAVGDGLAAIEAGLRAWVDRAVGAGAVAPPADGADLAAALLLAFEGVSVLARTGRADLEPAIDLLLAGLLGPEP